MFWIGSSHYRSCNTLVDDPGERDLSWLNPLILGQLHNSPYDFSILRRLDERFVIRLENA